MNILLMSNTYTPFVGGVERSIRMLALGLRAKGHRAVVVAPTFPHMPTDEHDVVRVPAIQRFNGTDFSVQLPVPGALSKLLSTWQPDVIHSHHPYLIGDTAMRLAARFECPTVFTFHTYYERYTHYVPGDSPALKRFVAALSAGYAELCEHVIAPSTSVAATLRLRGVTRPITVVPTGIDVEAFGKGDQDILRRHAGVDPEAFVVSHVSRLAPEKNVVFLARAVGLFLRDHPNAHFFIVGDGPSRNELRSTLESYGVGDRVHMFGVLQGEELVDAYRSADVFAFASKTETQGMVLAESMAAGTPVVALKGPGVEDIMDDGVNGRLVEEEEPERFAEALSWFASLGSGRRKELRDGALNTARNFDEETSVAKILSIYQEVIEQGYMRRPAEDSPWDQARRLIVREMKILSNMASATAAAMGISQEEGRHDDAGRSREK